MIQKGRDFAATCLSCILELHALQAHTEVVSKECDPWNATSGMKTLKRCRQPHYAR